MPKSRYGCGPRRLARLGLSDIGERLNLGVEEEVHTAYAILVHCRRLGYWTPFSLPAIKKASGNCEFPWPVTSFDSLRNAGFVEKLDVHVRRPRDMDLLFQVTPAFRHALFGADALATPPAPKTKPLNPEGQLLLSF